MWREGDDGRPGEKGSGERRAFSRNVGEKEGKTGERGDELEKRRRVSTAEKGTDQVRTDRVEKRDSRLTESGKQGEEDNDEEGEW